MIGENTIIFHISTIVKTIFASLKETFKILALATYYHVLTEVR